MQLTKMKKNTTILITFIILVLVFILIFKLYKEKVISTRVDCLHACYNTWRTMLYGGSNIIKLPQTTNNSDVDLWNNEGISCDNGNSYCSWRFILAKWIYSGGDNAMKNIFTDFDPRISWDTPPNLNFRPREFCIPHFCRSDCNTNIMAIIGQDTIFSHLKDGVNVDRCKNTIVFIEVNNSGKHWGEPGDVYVDKFQDFLYNLENEGFLICFLNGDIWQIDKNVPIETITPFLTINTAQTCSRSQLLPFSKVLYDTRLKTDRSESRDLE